MRNKIFILFRTPQRTFALIAGVIGMLFAFCTAPFQVPDEYNHFYRAFGISEGKIVPRQRDNRLGDFLPKSLAVTTEEISFDIPFHQENKQALGNIYSLLDLPLEPDKRTFIDFPNTALYTPIPYIPQVVAITLGRLVRLSPLLLMYLGRIFNLWAWIGLVYLSIKIIPVFKWPLTFLALVPIPLFQAASLSADAFTNGIAFLLVAYILQCAFDKNKIIRRADLLIIVLLTLLLTLSKLVYLPIALMFFLIPKAKIGTTRRYALTLILLIVVNGIAAGVSSIVVRTLYIPYSMYDPSIRADLPVYIFIEPQRQLDFILSHPGQYFGILIKGLWMRHGFNIRSAIGIIGWMDTPLPRIHIKMYVFLLLFIFLYDSAPDIKLPLRSRLLTLATFLITFFILCTFIYLSATPLKHPALVGLQGRYLTPLAPIFFLLFYNKTLKINVKYVKWTIIIYTICSLLIAFFIVLKRYYW